MKKIFTILSIALILSGCVSPIAKDVDYASIDVVTVDSFSKIDMGSGSSRVEYLQVRIETKEMLSTIASEFFPLSWRVRMGDGGLYLRPFVANNSLMTNLKFDNWEAPESDGHFDRLTGYYSYWLYLPVTGYSWKEGQGEMKSDAYDLRSEVEDLFIFLSGGIYFSKAQSPEVKIGSEEIQVILRETKSKSKRR